MSPLHLSLPPLVISFCLLLFSFNILFSLLLSSSCFSPFFYPHLSPPVISLCPHLLIRCFFLSPSCLGLLLLSPNFLSLSSFLSFSPHHLISFPLFSCHFFLPPLLVSSSPHGFLLVFSHLLSSFSFLFVLCLSCLLSYFPHVISSSFPSSLSLLLYSCLIVSSPCLLPQTPPR